VDGHSKVKITKAVTQKVSSLTEERISVNIQQEYLLKGVEISIAFCSCKPYIICQKAKKLEGNVLKPGKFFVDSSLT